MPHPAFDIRLLGPQDAARLSRCAPDVFDGMLSQHWLGQYLASPQHLLAVALDEGVVVGMATALHCHYPDKASQLWINEVGVAATHRRAGLGRALVGLLLQRGQQLGCHQAWVMTEATNGAARQLYTRAGGHLVEEGSRLFQFDLGVS